MVSPISVVDTDWPLTESQSIKTAVEKTTSLMPYCAKPYATTFTTGTHMRFTAPTLMLEAWDLKIYLWLCCTRAASYCIYMTARWAAGAISLFYPPSGECDYRNVLTCCLPTVQN